MIPQRTCLGCRRSDDQDVLIRLVRVGDEVVEGTSPRLPGRGAYLHPDADCAETARRRNALRRAFGAGARPGESLLRRLGEIAPGWIQTASGE